jgi:hypothetical protein
MSHDSNRTRIWFPMFSYFESTVDGIIPNEFDSISELLQKIFEYFANLLLYIKDLCMLTTRRVWDHPQVTEPKKRVKRSSSQTVSKKSTSSNDQSVGLRRSTGNLNQESSESILTNNNNVNRSKGPKKDD